MKRRPEPELMDHREQAKAYAEADFSEARELFLGLFHRLRPQPLGACKMIDLGCGPADITLRFARVCPQARIVGIDGAEAMLCLARRALAREPALTDRVELLCQRLPSAELPRARFDVVLSNSLLHHLQEPATLWRAVAHCARPRATVLVMDLSRPAHEAELERLMARYAADMPAILQRDFRNSLRAAYTVEEVRAQLAAAGLRGLQVEPVSDRHLAVLGVLQPCRG